MATIQANGGASSQFYSFEDMELTDRNYYRLKMVDLDGSFEMSKLEFVRKDCGMANHDFEIYPNPTTKNNQLNVRFFTNNTSAKFTIIDMLGRPVRILNLETMEGWNVMYFDISDLNPSNFILKLEDGMNTQTQQFSILK